MPSNCATPPGQDYVDGVWLETCDYYLDQKLDPAMDCLVQLLHDLIQDPDNRREILDKAYVETRNAYDKEHK